MTGLRRQKKMNSLMGFQIGETVWFAYHTGKKMEGTIASLSDKDKAGPVATLLTRDMGFRTVLLSKCEKSRVER